VQGKQALIYFNLSGFGIVPPAAQLGIWKNRMSA